MLQYKIPQDVGVADKIVRPLTLRQLIMIAIGCGISYVLYAITAKLYELNILEYIIIALPALIAVAAAFIKINGIPLLQFILLGLEYAIKPKKRMWDHRGISAIIAPDLGENKPMVEKSVKTEDKTKKNVNLDELSRVLDSGGFEHVEEVEHEGIDGAADDNLMIEAFFGHKEGTSANMWAQSAKDKDEYERKLKLLSELPKTEVKALKEIKEQIFELKKEKTPPVQAPPQAQKIIPIQTATEVKEKPVSKPQPVPPKKAQQTQPAPQPEKKPQPVQQPAPQIIKPPAPQVVKPPEPARQQAQKPAPQVVQPPKKKKKRRRKKKPKFSQPIRPETQVDNTQKKKPTKFTPNQKPTPPKKETPQPKVNTPLAEEKGSASDSKGGEIHLEELQKGEIELNLD